MVAIYTPLRPNLYPATWYDTGYCEMDRETWPLAAARTA